MTFISLPFKSRSTVNLGLHAGSASGNLGLVKFALDNGQPIDSVVNGLLPIHAACAGGHVQVVKYLLDRGADVNARRRPRRYSGSLLTSRASEELGSTALHFAAANGSIELVDLLLNRGAHPTVVDKYGSTPLSVALAKRNLGVANLLQKAFPIVHNHSTPTLVDAPLPSSGTRTFVTPLAAAKAHSAKDAIEKSDAASTSSSSTSSSGTASPISFSGLLRRKSFPDLRLSLSERSSTGPRDKPKTLRGIFRLYQKSISMASLGTTCSSVGSPIIPAVPSHVRTVL